METFAASSVVLITFPFSDLSRSKLRPAVVLADVGRGDWIMCQITSNPYADSDAILLADESFVAGSLQRRNLASIASSAHCRKYACPISKQIQ